MKEWGEGPVYPNMGAIASPAKGRREGGLFLAMHLNARRSRGVPFNAPLTIPA
ncbi:hypothetical protein [Shinella zoogloeoides]|uniref:Uncharacterized protein n=1 Tax=Shinella zoogloeoides TaxID=352475 RepID=A0A6N8TAL9_SHIZO|nr:hypothetical protein [Shinella zoogloeoides]MXO00277.1 hypothetical protein [Shinella zoogloeoides]UEX82598.1 hypothetical protein K8M09_04770 [Shinella zoogloeoides]